MGGLVVAWLLLVALEAYRRTWRPRRNRRASRALLARRAERRARRR